MAVQGSQQIAIISPYRAQIGVLDEMFKGDQRIIVNTIDSFQGQEREIVLISLVRSNETGEIGFLKDYRRLNVALTRAKKKLVVFGDSATLASDKFYSDFISFCEKINAYRTAWEYLE
jgi:superfamily I DNA and/or RNA helicase